MSTFQMVFFQWYGRLLFGFEFIVQSCRGIRIVCLALDRIFGVWQRQQREAAGSSRNASCDLVHDTF